MRNIILPAALAGLLGLGGPALAQAPTPTEVRTTGDLAAMCLPSATGAQRLEAIAYCQGYVTAAGQYHALLHPQGGRRRPIYCLPTPNPSVAQSAIAFATWARENPQYNQEPALDGLFRWARATYPCPQETAAPARTRPTR